MRSEHEAQLALECLKLAIDAAPIYPDSVSLLSAAGQFLSFVTGEQNDADSAKLEAIRKVVG